MKATTNTTTNTISAKKNAGNSFDKELFKRSVIYNVKTLYRKNLEEADPQQLFQAVALAMKDQIVDNWMTTQKAYEKEEALLFYILDQGIDKGDFDAEKCALMRSFVYRLIQGIDLLSIHEDNPLTDPNKIKSFIDFLVISVKK